MLDERARFWIRARAAPNKRTKERGKNLPDRLESGKVPVEGEAGGAGDLGEGRVGALEDVGDVLGLFGRGFGVKLSQLFREGAPDGSEHV